MDVTFAEDFVETQSQLSNLENLLLAVSVATLAGAVPLVTGWFFHAYENRVFSAFFIF